MTTIPAASKGPAPADCGSCNWSPDAAHPNTPGVDWEYVTFVDPGTWLCPACGMPNDVPPVDPAAAVEVPDLIPPSDPVEAPVPVESDSVGGTATGPDPAETLPSPLGPAGGTPDPGPSDDYPAAPAPVVELVPPADPAVPDDPFAPPDPVAATIAQLEAVQAAMAELQTVIVPQLLTGDVDPFTLADLLGAVIATAHETQVVGATISAHVYDAIQQFSSATVLGNDPEGADNGNE